MAIEQAVDPRLSDVSRWWHLDAPSPEIQRAFQAGWLTPGQRVLDLGCGLASDLGYLADHGVHAFGIDLSAHALLAAQQHRKHVRLIQGDVLHLPFADASFDTLLDRGCFHYVPEPARAGYAREAARVLRPNGRLLLHTSFDSAGHRTDLDEGGIQGTFGGWRLERGAELIQLERQPAGVRS